MGFKIWQLIVIGVLALIFFMFAGLCLYLKVAKDKENKYTGFSDAAQTYIFDMYGFTFDLFIPDASFLSTEITDLYGTENIILSGVLTKTGVHAKIDKKGLNRPSDVVINKNGIFISTEYWGYILKNVPVLVNDDGIEDPLLLGYLWFNKNDNVYARLGDGFTGEKLLTDIRTIILADGVKQTQTQNKLPALYIEDKSIIPQSLITDRFFLGVEGEVKVSIEPVEIKGEKENKTCTVLCDAGKNSFSVTIVEYKSYIADYHVSNYMEYEQVIEEIKETGN